VVDEKLRKHVPREYLVEAEARERAAKIAPKQTVEGRVKRLKSQIRELMKAYSDFEGLPRFPLSSFYILLNTADYPFITLSA
jgi:hypothetical protein